MKLSQLFKNVKIEENLYAVFNSLLMEIFFVDLQEYKKIISFTTNKLDDLCKAGIYINYKEQDDYALSLYWHDKNVDMKSVKNVYYK